MIGDWIKRITGRHEPTGRPVIQIVPSGQPPTPLPGAATGYIPRTAVPSEGGPLAVEKEQVRLFAERREELKRFGRYELGVTGTPVYGGQILTEPNPDMAFPKSLATFDKMRRTDGQVHAALLIIMLPILSLDWAIEPYAEIDESTSTPKEVTPLDRQAADFIRKDLLEGFQPFKHVLREVLGMIWAGFWILEKIYEVREDGLVHLHKLGTRLPQTIFRWGVRRNGELEFAVQRGVDPSTGGTIEQTLPAEDILIFVNNQEGADWQGQSVLRSAYKHFEMKDWLYRIGVINVERGGGFPVLSLPEGMNDQDLQAARDVGESIHVHERAYVLEPHGWRFRLEGTTSRIGDVMAQVEHHDRMISVNVLAQFLAATGGELAGRGSTAEYMDMFLMAEEVVIANIEEVFNSGLVRQLVDYNFRVEPGHYPKLKAQNVRGFNVRRMGIVLRTMVDGRLITPDEPLEEFLREAMGLPRADLDTRRDPMAQMMAAGGQGGDLGGLGALLGLGGGPKKPGGPGGPPTPGAPTQSKLGKPGPETGVPTQAAKADPVSPIPGENPLLPSDNPKWQQKEALLAERAEDDECIWRTIGGNPVCIKAGHGGHREGQRPYRHSSGQTPVSSFASDQPKGRAGQDERENLRWLTRPSDYDIGRTSDRFTVEHGPLRVDGVIGDRGGTRTADIRVSNMEKVAPFPSGAELPDQSMPPVAASTVDPGSMRALLREVQAELVKRGVSQAILPQPDKSWRVPRKILDRLGATKVDIPFRTPSPKEKAMRRDLGIPAPTDADRGSLVKTESMKALAEISDEDFALGELGEFVSSTELRIPEWETELARYAAAIPAADLAQDGVVGKHHVTLKYGLATSNAEDLRRLAASLPTMTLRLGATMVFPKPEADILVMRVFGEGLEEAHEQIQRYTPCQEDEQPYLPHVTLAYLKPGAGVRYAGDPALAGRAAIATELWFRPSTTSKLPDQALPLGVEDMQLAGIEEAWAKPLMISRPLRPLERAVNLHEIDRRCKLTATRMLQTVRPIGRQMAEAMVKACRECGEDNIQSLMDYRVPLQGKMASACKTYLADMFDFGQAQVREELARQHRQAQNPESDLLLAEPPRPIDNEKRARDVINLKADLLSRRWAERLKESAMNVMLAAARSGMPPGEAAQRIQEAADEITDRSSRQLVMNTLGDAFGLGRQVEAHRQRDYIGEAEYSAILDENTCDPCRQLDGRTGQLDEPAMQVPNPNCAGERYGSSCRCVLVFRYRGPSGGSGS